jgi:uncharacterized protein (TIGR04255 family)
MQQMSREKMEKIPELARAPLVEAIFELRWELEGNPQEGRLKDPAYPMLYGRLYERLQREFPVIEDLPSMQVHPEVSPYVVRHRMRREVGGWPLIQVGPGVITVNEGKGYGWRRFSRAIGAAVQGIIDLYPKSAALRFGTCDLRYINGFLFDPATESPVDFLREKLHIGVEVTPEIFELNDASRKARGASISLAYPLSSPSGHLLLNTGMGQVEGRSALIVQTAVQSAGEAVPQDSERLEAWLAQAHGVAVNCFASLCKGELMRSFTAR